MTPDENLVQIFEPFPAAALPLVNPDYFFVRLFRIRLWEIMKVNLLPAAVIGAGLALLLYQSGGTEEPMNYAR